MGQQVRMLRRARQLLPQHRKDVPTVGAPASSARELAGLLPFALIAPPSSQARRSAPPTKRRRLGPLLAKQVQNWRGNNCMSVEVE
jgi:hypothetical protein